MKDSSWKASFPAWTCENCPAHQSGIFSDLSAVQLRELEKGRVLDQFQSGQVLYYQGHHPLSSFCLLSGQVKVYKVLPDGQHRILRLAGPGDLIGHESLLKNEAYEATAEAMEDSYVCTLPRSIVLPILERNPHTLLNLLDKLSEDLAQLQRAGAIDRGHQTVSVRMAALLLDLNHRFGRPVHWGSSIELALSRAEIASMLGTTTETTIRILNRFQDQGILTLGRHAIDIKNLQALKEMTS